MTESDLIVVGVDGSKYSRQALQWALEEAHSHQQRVLVVSTWTNPPMPTDPPFGSFPWGSSTDRGPATREMLDAMIDELTPDYQEVAVERRTVSGNAAQQLITLSEQAALVVVGAKGHGGFAGMLLGSVSQHVLAHSRCTVVVVR